MPELAATLDAIAEDATSRCTVCGRCAEVCPTAREVGIDLTDPQRLVRGLIALTADGASGGDAARWAAACDSSGQCSAVCPEQINVRQWVSIARLRVQEATRDEQSRKQEQIG